MISLIYQDMIFSTKLQMHFIRHGLKLFYHRQTGGLTTLYSYGSKKFELFIYKSGPFWPNVVVKA